MELVRDLAEPQRQMRIDRERDRVRERDMEEKRRHSERREAFRNRLFQRQTKLVDLTQKYRKLNAELDMRDEKSRQLSEFYVNEGHLLEELCQLLDEESSVIEQQHF